MKGAAIRRAVVSATALAVAEAQRVTPPAGLTIEAHGTNDVRYGDSVAQVSSPTAVIGTMQASATKAQILEHHKLKMDLKKRRRGA